MITDILFRLLMAAGISGLVLAQSVLADSDESMSSTTTTTTTETSASSSPEMACERVRTLYQKEMSAAGSSTRTETTDICKQEQPVERWVCVEEKMKAGDLYSQATTTCGFTAQ